jgi:hypothetical protein
LECNFKKSKQMKIPAYRARLSYDLPTIAEVVKAFEQVGIVDCGEID